MPDFKHIACNFVQGIAIKIGMFPLQIPLGARPGFRTQLPYKAPSNLWVNIVENTVINIG